MYKRPIEGAKKILKVCLGVKSGESVTVVTEESTLKYVIPFLDAAKELNLDRMMVVMPDIKFNGEEPSKNVQQAMMLSEVLILATNLSISTIDALKEAQKKGIRIFSIPSFTSESLVKGPIEADFLKIKGVIRTVASLMSKTKIVNVKTENGSDLTFSLEGRSGNAHDALALEPGTFKSMSVEANIAPLENSANGILMVDVASPTNVNHLLEPPLKITFKEGLIVKIEGSDDAVRLQRFLDEIGDKNVFRIAELGIGLNPSSTLTGHHYIEDESVMGTAHIGIGRNTSIEGTTQAKGHFDLIFKRPDIYFDNVRIMKDGKLEI